MTDSLTNQSIAYEKAKVLNFLEEIKKFTMQENFYTAAVKTKRMLELLETMRKEYQP